MCSSDLEGYIREAAQKRHIFPIDIDAIVSLHKIPFEKVDAATDILASWMRRRGKTAEDFPDGKEYIYHLATDLQYRNRIKAIYKEIVDSLPKEFLPLHNSR